MDLDPRTRAFIKQVRQAILSEKKSGVLSRLFKKKEEPADEHTLTGLEVRGYLLGERLGVGAHGVVYAATDPKENAVAIKVLPKPESNDDAATTLFERETKIGQTIEHPAVVKTLHSFELGPAQFVIMERVDGVTLAKTLASKVPVSRFLELFEPLAEGIQAAHDKGVVHRDLKPENVMLTPTGEVKILDFGMARLEQDVSVTATGTFKGTIHYTSPEQIADSKRVDAASDQFAFGLMCFEALTGDFAFEVDDKKPMEAIMGRMECKPKTLLSVAPDLGEAASTVIARMLSLDPRERYGSVKEGFEALKAAL